MPTKGHKETIGGSLWWNECPIDKRNPGRLTFAEALKRIKELEKKCVKEYDRGYENGYQNGCADAFDEWAD